MMIMNNCVIIMVIIIMISIIIRAGEPGGAVALGPARRLRDPPRRVGVQYDMICSTCMYVLMYTIIWYIMHT